MKTIKILLLTLPLLLSVSCTTTIEEKLDKYIDKVEQECDGYTTEDWEKTNLQFEELLAQFEENYDNMTPEEREVASKAVGRYYGLAAKQGLKESAEQIENILELVPDFFEGFSDAFNEDEE